jgi:hypothetical protein
MIITKTIKFNLAGGKGAAGKGSEMTIKVSVYELSLV